MRCSTSNRVVVISNPSRFRTKASDGRAARAHGFGRPSCFGRGESIAREGLAPCIDRLAQHAAHAHARLVTPPLAAGGVGRRRRCSRPARRTATPGAQGSDKPEKEEVQIGFIPLTDCASVVMASVLGFDKKYGVKIVPTKEASLGRRARQARQRRARHGARAVRPDLRRAPRHRRAEEGHGRADEPRTTTARRSRCRRRSPTRAPSTAASLAKLMASEKREYTFAGTFPTGTHAMWIHYWLASVGHQPDARTPSSSPCRRRRWWPTCAWATWTATASASRGAIARDHGRHRHHRDDHAGHLEGPPGEGARHHRRLRQEVPEHLRAP